MLRTFTFGLTRLNAMNSLPDEVGRFVVLEDSAGASRLRLIECGRASDTAGERRTGLRQK